MKLKGGTNKRGRKPKFTDQQIVELMLARAGGKSNKEAFVEVSRRHGLELTRSYLTKAAGHYYRIKLQVEQRVKDSDKALITLLNKNNLVL